MLPQSTIVLKFPSDFRFDKRKEGCELVENVLLLGESTLSLAEFLQNKELSVKGKTMLERSKVMSDNAAGQLHAERLLDQQDAIPRGWRDYILIFTGTVWRSPDGLLFVPCLLWDWDNRKWELDFLSLSAKMGFDSRFLLVRFIGPSYR